MDLSPLFSTLMQLNKMFLKLNHQKLDIYCVSKELVLECYRLTKFFPPEERYSMVSQIRRAALSVHLNIVEGSSRKSTAERKRFYEIARGSVIEIDAAIDIANALEYFRNMAIEELGEKIIRCFGMLSGLIRNS